MLRKISKKSLPYLLFLLISLFLVYVFSYKLKATQFLYMGDQFFRFNYYETFVNSFFIRKWENLGVFNCWQLMAQFWDVIYYLIVYKVGVSLEVAEKLLFFIVLFFTQTFSYIGFKKIKSLFNLATGGLAVFVITLWYSFNTYTLVLWHGGVYNLGVLMSAALVPLIFYYFYKSIFTKSLLKEKIICAILLFFASFTFWLFAALVFFLIVFSFFYVLFNIKKLILYLKNLGYLLACYLPLAGIIIFSIVHEYLNNAGDLNGAFSPLSPTFALEKGGLWYQFLMLFSWGMYNVWVPRSIYPFTEYFMTKKYIISTISIYLIAFVGLGAYFFTSIKEFILKSKMKLQQRKNLESKDLVIIIFVLSLLIALFFAKGNQPPLGEIFLFMYQHVPFFSVFRSADHRFGFIVVLSLSLILLFVSHKINKYLFFVFIFTAMLGQDILFFNGTAIYGKNIDNSFYDRVVYISEDYQEVINAINSDNESFGYVLPIPPIEYGDYAFDNGEHHIGQDMLSKLIRKPFVYISASTGISGQTASTLYTYLTKKDYKSLNNFPIKYIVLRKDILCAEESCINSSEEELQDNFRLLFKNSTFSIFENDSYPSIIVSPNSIFKIINPVKYKVKMTTVSEKTALGFMDSFNKNWKVYVTPPSKDFCKGTQTVTIGASTQCLSDMKYFEGEEVFYNLTSPSFEETRFLANNYANGWIVDPGYVKNVLGKDYYTQNPDGSINFDLIIFYKPQAAFYLFGTISFLTLVSFLIYLYKDQKIYNFFIRYINKIWLKR